MTSKVDTCYSLDYPDDLNCIKEFVRQSQGEACQPQLVLLTQEGCEVCAEQKSIHSEALREGIIQELNVDSTRGLEVIRKNDLEYVPALVLLDCQDNLILPASESV